MLSWAHIHRHPTQDAARSPTAAAQLLHLLEQLLSDWGGLAAGWQLANQISRQQYTLHTYWTTCIQVLHSQPRTPPVQVVQHMSGVTILYLAL